MDRERFVVIGGVAAGMSAASRAKRNKPDMEVIVLERGSFVSYGSCGIPYFISDLVKDVQGLVVHDAEKCIGCWTCIMVCSYGAIKPDSSGKIVVKCDLCPNLEVPACVANCPNEALVCEEVNP